MLGKNIKKLENDYHSNCYILALGYFDSVHIGHRKVLNEAILLAKENKCKVCVFSFKGNLRAFFNSKKEKSVYLPFEREQLINKIGINEVFFAPVTKTFLAKGKNAFLNYLLKNINIKGFVCGSDYKFGKNGKGDTDFLRKYCSNNNLICKIVDILTYSNAEIKISTSLIKRLLENGEIENANKLLGSPFFIKGKVISDRGVGKKLGYPTANIKCDKEKVKLKNGVYFGHVVFNNIVYKAVINYGARPTFSLNEVLIEAHILNFNKNIYGEIIDIYFDKFLRDIKKFNSEKELKAAIQQDVEKAKNLEID